MSGIDCMVLVIQQVLRSLSRQASQRLLRRCSKNFLVDSVVRDFARVTKSQRENMQNARDVF